MKPTRQDHSLIQENVLKWKKDYELPDIPGAFYYFTLDLLLGLDYDEITDSITDNFFLQKTRNAGGHDRGIDAVIIEELSSNSRPIVKLFNFKYSESFEKLGNNFPSSEIDKILSFLRLVNEAENGEYLKNEVNPILLEKIKEIWQLQTSNNVEFKIYLCANFYNSFEKSERERFEREIKKLGNTTCEYILMDELVNLLTNKSKEDINAKIIVSSDKMFEKSDGEIRALILTLNVRDCVRIVLDNDKIRETPNVEDYSELLKYPILENAFDDNVRVYLKQKPRINKNIKATALSIENHRFFYFNNGITITCSDFFYPSSYGYPIIELKNLQIVNGSQTIHALYDALKEDYSKLKNAFLLCRIYQLKDQALSANIAQYTNSQNPVKNRDIRSIDYIQIKLEKDLNAIGYFYERKKNQFSNEDKKLRLDAEKIGQILMSFYNSKPSEAKNKKTIIFQDEYENIFNDDITSEKVLLPYKLYLNLEEDKKEKSKLLKEDPKSFEEKGYFLYSTYYLLYIMSELADIYRIEKRLKNVAKIWELYPETLKIIEEINALGKKDAVRDNKNFTYATFYKSNNPKDKFIKDIKPTLKGF